MAKQRWGMQDCANALLVAMLIATAWMFGRTHSVDQSRYPGGDFLQFYTAGAVIDRGNPERLYDQSYFREFERSIYGDQPAHYSLYPPMMAAAMSVLARFSFGPALAMWLVLQGACLAGACVLLYRTMAFSRPWRWTALLALFTVFPLWMMLYLKHLTSFLLLVVAVGLTLHARDRRATAGLLLSLLAIKPQLAAGVFLWLLLRRDVRAIAGMVMGGLLQVAATAALLGPGIFVQYVEAFPTINRVLEGGRFTPITQGAIAGTLLDLLTFRGYHCRESLLASELMRLLPAVVAGCLLLQVMRVRRRLTGQGAAFHQAVRYEHAALVLFLVLAPPYLLSYDLLLLAIPLVHILSSPRWRAGMVLYLAMTPVALIAYLVMGISLLPFVALWTMAQVAAAARSLAMETLGPGAASTPALTGVLRWFRWGRWRSTRFFGVRPFIAAFPNAFLSFPNSVESPLSPDEKGGDE
jgi:hypothetical protein